MDRVRKSLIRERCGFTLSVLERIERNVLKWFGLVERIEEERLVKRVYRANADDTALVADSEKLRSLERGFGRVWDRR